MITASRVWLVEQGEVHRPPPALSGKVQHAGVGVVVEIADEKDHRGCKGGDHGALVSLDLPAADEALGGYQQNGGGAVQGCVDGREVGERGRLHGSTPQAAGLVLRRLATTKARLNMMTVKTTSTARQVASGNSGDAVAGKSRPRNASVP